LALIPAAQAVLNETGKSIVDTTTDDEETRLVKKAKKIALFAIGIAFQKYAAELEKEQEVLMNVSDIIMETFAMESSLLRRRKLAASGKEANAADICAVFLRDAMDRIACSARNVIGTCSSKSALRRDAATLQNFAEHDPIDAITLRRNIARGLLAEGRYGL
jgi:hypothetical protein